MHGVPDALQEALPDRGGFAIVDSGMQPLTSWSADRTIAEEFASTTPGSFLYAIEVPVSWVIGSARTGFGCLHEFEFVLLGPEPVWAWVERR